MKRPIPEQIVAAVSELAEGLATWCEEGRDGRLEQHEGAVLERVRAVLPQLLEAVVEASRQRTSAGLLGWLARLGATTDYREAAELLDVFFGLTVATETIRRA